MGLILSLFGFCGFILFVVAQVAMLMNRKPGVKLFDAAIFGNPLAIQYFGRRYLTERGIFWRNVSWITLGVLVLSFFVFREIALRIAPH